MVTIEDIAREAGVSATTVSNVIHGRTNKVSSYTVDLINEIIRERGYVPSLSARAMRIIPLRKNTGSATTAAADVPPPGRPSAVSQPVPSQRSS